MSEYFGCDLGWVNHPPEIAEHFVTFAAFGDRFRTVLSFELVCEYAQLDLPNRGSLEVA